MTTKELGDIGQQEVVAVSLWTFEEIDPEKTFLLGHKLGAHTVHIPNKKSKFRSTWAREGPLSLLLFSLCILLLIFYVHERGYRGWKSSMIDELDKPAPAKPPAGKINMQPENTTQAE